MDLNTMRAPKVLLLPAVLALAILIALFFVGCATPAASSPDPAASAAVVEEPTQTPPAPDLSKVAFGEVFTYEDGVSVSVSAPVAFVPSEWSSASTSPEDTQWYYFKIVLSNNSGADIDPYTIESVSSGGKESPSVFDMGNEEVGAIGDIPTTSVQPGQTVEWLVGYGLSDPASITFDIQPGFQYEETTFTNIAP